MSEQKKSYKYKAFLSYSQTADRALAPALQSGLQRITASWRQLRAIHVYRDETDIPTTSALLPRIKEALRESEFFILLASPRAAASPWVQIEIDYWLSLNPAEKFLIVLTDGDEPVWDQAAGDFSWDKNTNLPSTLKNRFRDEPKFTDLRWARERKKLRLREERFYEAVADLASTLRGVDKSTLVGEDARQLRKNRRLASSAVVALLILLFATSAAAVVAFNQRNKARANAEEAQRNQTEANRQKKIAEDNLATALANEKEAKRQQGIAEQSRKETEEQRQIAETRRQEAVRNADEAKRQQEKALFSSSQSKASELAARSHAAELKSPNISMALAINSLARLKDHNLIPKEGEEALRSAIAASHGQHVFCQASLRDQNSDDMAAFDVSPNRDLLAVGTVSGVLCFYQRDTDAAYHLIEMLQSFGGESISQVRFTGDGKRLITWTNTGYLRSLELAKTVLDKNTPKFLENNHRFDTFGTNDQVQRPAFDGKASRVAFYRKDERRVEVWDFDKFDTNGTATHSFPAESEVLAVGLSPDGQSLATLLRDDPRGRRQPGTIPEPEDSKGHFSVIIRSLTTGAEKKIDSVLTQINWHLDDDHGRGTPEAIIKLDNASKWLAVAIKLYEAHRIQQQLAAEVWDISGKRPERVQLYAGDYPGEKNGAWTSVSDLGLSADGNWLYATHDTLIRLWRLSDKQPGLVAAANLSSPATGVGARKSLGVIYTVAVSPDSRWLAAGDSNGVMTVWDLQTYSDPGGMTSFSVEPADQLISSCHIVGFSQDANLVAAGGDNGSLKLCRVADRCGPLEPIPNAAPKNEGQWISWVADEAQTWIAAVTESRRVHFWRPDDIGQEFFRAGVLDKDELIPVKSTFYVVTSGVTGRPVAVVPSPSGDWVALFEQEQYGANGKLILMRPGDATSRIELGPKELQCGAFSWVTFDLQSRHAIAWYNRVAMERCASLIDLPPTGANPTEPPKVTRLKEFKEGLMTFSNKGNYIINDPDYITGRANLWRRNADGKFSPMPLNDITDRVFIDPNERWLLIEEGEGQQTRSLTEEFETQETRTYKLTASALPDAMAGQVRPVPAVLGRYVGKPEVEFSPKGTWLVVSVVRKKEKERVVQLWRVNDFTKPVAEWHIPSEPPESIITFDSEERFLVVGPSSFIVPVYDAPAAQVAALFVDLRRREPKPKQLGISTSGYRSHCGSSPRLA